MHLRMKSQMGTIVLQMSQSFTSPIPNSLWIQRKRLIRADVARQTPQGLSLSGNRSVSRTRQALLHHQERKLSPKTCSKKQARGSFPSSLSIHRRTEAHRRRYHCCSREMVLVAVDRKIMLMGSALYWRRTLAWLFSALKPAIKEKSRSKLDSGKLNQILAFYPRRASRELWCFRQRGLPRRKRRKVQQQRQLLTLEKWSRRMIQWSSMSDMRVTCRTSRCKRKEESTVYR